MKNNDSLLDAQKRADITQRTIHAPCAVVFKAFSTPELLARWWGPEGFTSTFKEFDLRKDGDWRFTMHGPDGTDYPNENRFVEVIENEKIVIEHVLGHHFFLTLTFTPKGDTTVIGWCQLFDTVEEYQKLAEFVARANQQNLDKWEAVVKELMGSD